VLAAVIVPFRDASATLERCLRALTLQDLPPSAYEIIAVDDGSVDDSARIARGFDRVRYIACEPGGSYAARNRGLAVSSGSLVAFTDADCVANQNGWPA
jgi:glycosyltransferase involved in cell wall biosynthesis